MGQEATYPINDTHRAIEAVAQSLREFDSPRCDPRIKAIILTKLQEAQLFSLLLIKEE